ncbi:unnamed protein product [Coffea canephora]|uniref:Enoyl reductase (ER) domain-containing protein n=2 Tax=Coffea TaxID=13442 RepID=A0A068V1P7_COFCA|nr:unnamed protein product [Coffea canephora]
MRVAITNKMDKSIVYPVRGCPEALTARMVDESVVKDNEVGVSNKMKAVFYDKCGGPEVITLREVDAPVVGDYEVLIQVAATTFNRMDLWPRLDENDEIDASKKYPIGMECSGKILRTGKFVAGWKQGDEVCALLQGGGCADLVAVPAYHIISPPKKLDLASAAALPRAACLIWHCFFLMNKLTNGQKVLIHGGAGGVGTLAIQIAKHYGCQVFATAGSKERVELCAALGADVCINHKEEDFSQRVKAETNGAGVNYILDCVGVNFLNQNVKSLAYRGKLIIIGFEDPWGFVNFNSKALEDMELEIMGADLNTLHLVEKARLLLLVKKNIWPLVEVGSIKPIIGRAYTFDKAVDALRLIEKHGNLGKILLIPDNT